MKCDGLAPCEQFPAKMTILGISVHSGSRRDPNACVASRGFVESCAKRGKSQRSIVRYHYFRQALNASAEHSKQDNGFNLSGETPKSEDLICQAVKRDFK